MSFEINGPEDFHKLVLTSDEFKAQEGQKRKRVYLTEEQINILQQGLVLLLNSDPEMTSEFRRKIELIGYGLTDVKVKFNG